MLDYAINQAMFEDGMIAQTRQSFRFLKDWREAWTNA